MVLVDVYAVVLTRKGVTVPDTCPKCGNGFNEPTESSLLSLLLDSESYWSYVETVRGRRYLREGERHGSGLDRKIRGGLICGECGYEVAAPIIEERGA